MIVLIVRDKNNIPVGILFNKNDVKSFIQRNDAKGEKGFHLSK